MFVISSGRTTPSKPCSSTRVPLPQSSNRLPVICTLPPCLLGTCCPAFFNDSIKASAPFFSAFGNDVPALSTIFLKFSAIPKLAASLNILPAFFITVPASVAPVTRAALPILTAFKRSPPNPLTFSTAFPSLPCCAASAIAGRMPFPVPPKFSLSPLSVVLNSLKAGSNFLNGSNNPSFIATAASLARASNNIIADPSSLTFLP